MQIFKKKSNKTPNSVVDILSDSQFMEIYMKCKPFTLTSIERMYALYRSTMYIVKKNISGDFLECGVWRGGSTMLMALSLVALKDFDRKIYLYDTFEGMPAPTNKDIDFQKKSAQQRWNLLKKKSGSGWCAASLTEVQNNLATTSYPQEKLIYVKGAVEKTIPSTVPDQIALLRLDTDFYDSTWHELTYLYPRLTKDGVLIIDDYGHWQGAKEATDKYFLENKINLFLGRIDYTGRILIK